MLAGRPQRHAVGVGLVVGVVDLPVAAAERSDARRAVADRQRERLDDAAGHRLAAAEVALPRRRPRGERRVVADVTQGQADVRVVPPREPPVE